MAQTLKTQIGTVLNKYDHPAPSPRSLSPASPQEEEQPKKRMLKKRDPPSPAEESDGKSYVCKECGDLFEHG